MSEKSKKVSSKEVLEWSTKNAAGSADASSGHVSNRPEFTHLDERLLSTLEALQKLSGFDPLSLHSLTEPPTPSTTGRKTAAYALPIRDLPGGSVEEAFIRLEEFGDKILQNALRKVCERYPDLFKDLF